MILNFTVDFDLTTEMPVTTIAELIKPVFTTTETHIPLTTISNILTSTVLSTKTTLQPKIFIAPKEVHHQVDDTVLEKSNSNEAINFNIANSTEDIPFDALESTTEIPFDTVNNTTSSNNFLNISIDSSNKIKFDITNFTTLDSNGTDSRSYALRIHLQGFKWNDKFNDVNSSEAVNFLQGHIIPLLIERLNLSSDDLHDVRLIKLFKGSVQSELEIKTKNFLNHTTLLNTNSSSWKSNLTEFTGTASAQSSVATNEYSIKIMKGFDTKSKCTYKEISQLVCFCYIINDFLFFK